MIDLHALLDDAVSGNGFPEVLTVLAAVADAYAKAANEPNSLGDLAQRLRKLSEWAHNEGF